MASLCGAKTPVEHLLDFEFIAAVVCPYSEVAGLTVVGLMVFGAVAGSIYIRTGSALVPVILMLLTGGVTMSFIAGPGVGIATVVLLMAGAGTVAYLYNQYTR